MAKNKLNKNWLHDHINDPYVKLAQKEGYRARAVYKLKEIDEAEKLIKHGQVIVDLGCTPGSWSQYVRNKLAGQEGGGVFGTIIGLDMLPMEPIADVHFIQGDFREESVLQQLDEKSMWYCQTLHQIFLVLRLRMLRALSTSLSWQ
jgi:23S rRNA (uridine2552-2'-O)-methyltransferase